MSISKSPIDNIFSHCIHWLLLAVDEKEYLCNADFTTVRRPAALTITGQGRHTLTDLFIKPGNKIIQHIILDCRLNVRWIIVITIAVREAHSINRRVATCNACAVPASRHTLQPVFATSANLRTTWICIICTTFASYNVQYI